MDTHSLTLLATAIKKWGEELGFNQIGITDTELSAYEKRLDDWLAHDFHGTMYFMEKHGTKRSRPAELIPNTLRVISARMDYLPQNTNIEKVLLDKTKGYVSRYTLGRDYHRLIRKRLKILAKKIRAFTSDYSYRVFCDSAPVLEKGIAEKAGLGWIGKHTNLIHSKAGSWFFLGEIYTDIPLPMDKPVEKSHCGTCTACIDICPTKAIIGPYQLDARRCIAYLTVEFRGVIPVELRPLIGNRVYGCDDCQLICPWNKFTRYTKEAAFQPRHHLDAPDLLDLFAWTEEEFLRKTEGSAIRRIGYECWLRNIAIALGNAPYSDGIIQALKMRLQFPSPLVREHVQWALEQLLSFS